MSSRKKITGLMYMREKGTTFSYYLRCRFLDGVVRVVVYTSLAQFLLQDDVWATETAAPPCTFSERKWNNEGRLRLMAGRQQSLGQVGLFSPLLQDATSLLFTDIRFFRSTKHNSEGNFGLAHRQIVPSLEWIFGGYGFFDNRRTEHHKNFQQGTFGLEALSVYYDVRTNIYVPFSKSKKIHSKTTKPVFQGHSEYFNATKEFALRGFDYEIGRSVPHLDCLRLFVAGYNFQAHGVESINGVRARFRLDVNRYINVDGEYQYDNVRHSAPYIGFTIRIPFGEVTEKPLTPLEKRMQADIIRDIDIVTQPKKLPELEPSGREFIFTRPGGTGDGTYENPAPAERVEVIAQLLEKHPKFLHYDLEKNIIKTAPQKLEELRPIIAAKQQPQKKKKWPPDDSPGNVPPPVQLTPIQRPLSEQKPVHEPAPTPVETPVQEDVSQPAQQPQKKKKWPPDESPGNLPPPVQLTPIQRPLSEQKPVHEPAPTPVQEDVPPPTEQPQEQVVPSETVPMEIEVVRVEPTVRPAFSETTEPMEAEVVSISAAESTTQLTSSETTKPMGSTTVKDKPKAKSIPVETVVSMETETARVESTSQIAPSETVVLTETVMAKSEPRTQATPTEIAGPTKTTVSSAPAIESTTQLTSSETTKPIGTATVKDKPTDKLVPSESAAPTTTTVPSATGSMTQQPSSAASQLSLESPALQPALITPQPASVLKANSQDKVMTVLNLDSMLRSDNKDGSPIGDLSSFEEDISAFELEIPLNTVSSKPPVARKLQFDLPGNGAGVATKDLASFLPTSSMVEDNSALIPFAQPAHSVSASAPKVLVEAQTQPASTTPASQTSILTQLLSPLTAPASTSVNPALQPAPQLTLSAPVTPSVSPLPSTVTLTSSGSKPSTPSAPQPTLTAPATPSVLPLPSLTSMPTVALTSTSLTPVTVTPLPASSPATPQASMQSNVAQLSSVTSTPVVASAIPLASPLVSTVPVQPQSVPVTPAALAVASKKSDSVAKQQAREQQEAARQAKAEADRQAKAEADRQAKAEADRQAKAEADRQAKAEADRQAKAEADRQAKAEADRQAKAEADRQAKAEADRQAKAEADRQAEAKRLADEEAARQAEVKRLADEEAARQAEAKRLADEEAARQAEAKRLADEEAA
ncbi:MAG: inverse autotransporter beta domain-containing protein, partial [Alphaproteobacteria bacterium]|nr:inverse autotransporter beta domain-containing protein [Alphaproteobacteria bacterium]